MLSLATALRETHESHFLSFAENGRARSFLDLATAQGFMATELRENWPRYFRAAKEVARELIRSEAQILCTSGYKPDIIGLRAARIAGIPAVAIAHGWTGATWKVRLNESLDRWTMRRFDAVVGVSHAQSTKLALAGISPEKITTIPNAIAPERWVSTASGSRERLAELFPNAPRFIVAAAGRLSPEKGFNVFISSAAQISQQRKDIGFVVFGDGPLRDELSKQINKNSLEDSFILAGFHENLDIVLPAADLFVIPSFTEGLPVVLLEALLAGLPVVATAVGGIPEVIADGTDGFLVPAGNIDCLAQRIMELLDNPDLRKQMRIAGPKKVASEYNTRLQADRYSALFAQLSRASNYRLDNTAI